jgi:tetratricopeptide (TPR) repeat protein
MGRGAEMIRQLEYLIGKQAITGVRTNALRVLGQIYIREDRKLEAAQTLEELARSGELSAEEKGSAWLDAARIYLDQGLTEQVIEIGRRALLLEEEQLALGNPRTWSDSVANGIRLMMARSFSAMGDREKSEILLTDVLRRPGLNPHDRGYALYLLGETRLQLGNPELAREILESAIADGEVPQIWKKAAAQTLAVIPEPTASLEASGGGL